MYSSLPLASVSFFSQARRSAIASAVFLRVRQIGCPIDKGALHFRHRIESTLRLADTLEPAICCALAFSYPHMRGHVTHGIVAHSVHSLDDCRKRTEFRITRGHAPSPSRRTTFVPLGPCRKRTTTTVHPIAGTFQADSCPTLGLWGGCLLL